MVRSASRPSRGGRMSSLPRPRAGVSQQRKPRFELDQQMIRTVSRLALVATLFSACGEVEPEDAGELGGELVTYIADFEDHAEVRHALRQASGEERPLLFEAAPALPAGARAAGWGAARGGGLS